MKNLPEEQGLCASNKKWCLSLGVKTFCVSNFPVWKRVVLIRNISPFSCCLVEQSIQLCWFAAQIISNWWKNILNVQE